LFGIPNVNFVDGIQLESPVMFIIIESTPNAAFEIYSYISRLEL